MKIQSLLFLILSMLFPNSLYSHGFCISTPVKRADKSWPIEQIYKNPQKQKLWISSFDLQLQSIGNHDITRVGKSQTNCFIRIAFDDNYHNDILCTPSQELFLVSQQRFVPACQLQVGDELYSAYQKFMAIKSIELVKEPLMAYALEVDKTHNFFVGNYGILAHNMFFPELMSLSAVVAPTMMTGATVVAAFGPITFAGGVALGGVIGIAFKIFSDKVRSKYLLHFDIDKVATQLKGGILYGDNEDAQAPGKPTEKDGFIPKKNWDSKKVRHPKTGQVGYPDKKGNIWVPTGPGTKAHGGPHWDVVYPNGDYDNVYPGGRIRKGRRK